MAKPKTAPTEVLISKYEPALAGAIDFLLKDDRNCCSPNLKRFFRNKRNRYYYHVIIFEDQLWFVTLGWRVGIKKDGTACDTGFAGVKVRTVACFGSRAKTAYPGWQNGNDYKIVTDWFWNNYRENGVVGFPDIWHIKVPPKLTSKEAHQV